MMSLVEIVQIHRAEEQLASVDFGSEVRRAPGNPFRRGAENCRHKRLSPEAVLDIRRRRRERESLASIGSRHGLSEGMVSKIVRGKAYAWVEETTA